MLATFHFLDVPIVSKAQAVGVAVKHLPADAQPPADCDCCGPNGWSSRSGRFGRYETHVDPVDAGFVVEFALHAGGGESDDSVTGRWRFLVYRDGTMESLSEE
jgi:hypothetical protein